MKDWELQEAMNDPAHPIHAEIEAQCEPLGSPSWICELVDGCERVEVCAKADRCLGRDDFKDALERDPFHNPVFIDDDGDDR